MLILTVFMVIIGTLLIVLSRWRQDELFGRTLPNYMVRRVWLPLGLLCYVFAILFGLMTSIRLPSSPLYQAETRGASQQLTSYMQNTRGYQTLISQTATVTPSPLPLDYTLTAVAMTGVWRNTQSAELTNTPAR